MRQDFQGFEILTLVSEPASLRKKNGLGAAPGHPNAVAPFLGRGGALFQACDPFAVGQGLGPPVSGPVQNRVYSRGLLSLAALFILHFAGFPRHQAISLECPIVKLAIHILLSGFGWGGSCFVHSEN
jgi:hypothetical protein